MVSSSKQSPLASSFSAKVLLAIVLIQWALIMYLLRLQQEQVTENVSGNRNDAPVCPSLPKSSSSVGVSIPVPVPVAGDEKLVGPTKWEGVAFSLVLKRPRWYVKRYSTLIHNALSNIPDNWALQLMVYEPFFQNDVLGYHRGLKRLIQDNPRIIITKIPPHLETQKPKVLLSDRWVWEKVVADRVLIFNGDGFFCSNSRVSWDAFDDLDYVGVPWNMFDGRGGGGSTHSLRNRTAMLAAIDYSGPGRPANKKQDAFFVSMLLQMNKDAGTTKYKIATREQTEFFGGTANLVFVNGTLIKDEDWGPMLITGTMGNLPHQARSWALSKCPEIKAIFPSLHHPACFGAKPNPLGCAASQGFPPPCVNSTGR
jgi:hypothetical protein